MNFLSRILFSLVLTVLSCGAAEGQVTQNQPPPKPFTVLDEIGIQETQFNPGNTASTITADTTANVNDFIALASSKALALQRRAFPGSTGLYDQLPFSCVMAVVNYRPVVSSPIVNQLGVCPVFPYGIQLASPSQLGNCASEPGSWDGTLTALALCNPTQPVFIEPNNTGYIDFLYVYPHNGTQFASGTFWGKSWVPFGGTCTPLGGASGSNWTVGDIFNLPQPGPVTYLIPTGTVDGVNGSGAVTSCHINSGGFYMLPEKLRERYWTVARGYTGTAGTIATNNFGNVFDPSNPGNYFTTKNTVVNPSATGLEVAITDSSDYVAGQYNGGNCQQQHLQFNSINVQGASTVNDPTYGPAYAFAACGRSVVGNSINSGGGWFNIWDKATDFHVAQMVPVSGAQANLKIAASSVDGSVILDTPVTHNLEIDGANGVNLNLRAFHNSTTSTMTDGCIDIGSSGSVSSDIHLSGTIQSCGGDSASVPAILAANVTGLVIDNMNVSNCDTSATPPACNAVAHPNPNFIQFGSNVGNCDVSGVISGPSGTVTQAILGTVPPSCRVNIQNNSTGTIETGADYLNWPQDLIPFNAQQALSQWSTLGATTPPTITDNNVLGPDGNKSASTVNYSVTSPNFFRWINATGLTANTPVCFYGQVQEAASSAVGTEVIKLGNSTSSVSGGFTINMATGVVSSVLAPTGSATYQTLGTAPTGNTGSTTSNPWYSFWLEMSLPGTTNPEPFLVNNSGSSGNINFTNLHLVANPKRCPLVNNANFGGNTLLVDTVNKRVLSNANVPTAPVTPVSGTVDQTVGADGTNAAKEVDSFGGTASFRGYRTDGTAASKTAVQSGDVEADLSGRGYDVSGDPPTNANGSFKVEAAENQDSTHHGSKACLATVASGTTGTPADGLCQQPSAGVTIGSPTGGDEGAGSLNAQSLFVQGVAVGSSTINNAFAQSGAGFVTPADATEDVLASVSIPANTLGANGCIEVMTAWNYTGSTNSKTMRIRFNTSAAAGGTTYQSIADSTLADQSRTILTRWCNANATNSQYGQNSVSTFGNASSANVTTSAIDTTAQSFIVFTGQKASSGETLTLVGYTVKIFK